MIAPSPSRPVEIVGGGLAGLGLGLGLRRRGIPVIVIEAGSYPRHRVCGEFITSLDRETIAALDLSPLLETATEARSVTWFQAGAAHLVHPLPVPALCLSRHYLDHRMAQRFVELGGELVTHQRGDLQAAEGRVITTGRRPKSASRWIGIKAHFRGLTLRDDLELHLGKGAYVGLTRIEGNRVNVCGLFARTPSTPSKQSKRSILFDQLNRVGLADLNQRLQVAAGDESSLCTVAGLDYGPAAPTDGALRLGDQFGLIPPFTGNGMTVALQSARIATDPLRAWSTGQCDWPTTVQKVHRALHRELSPRIGRARRLHPWLLRPQRQRWLVKAAGSRLFPTRLLYHLLH